MSRVNPYQVLLEEAQDYARKVQDRHKKTMWSYPKAKLSVGWGLNDLAERTAAATQLGYDVVLTVNEGGDLVVTYVKKPPLAPWRFRP